MSDSVPLVVANFKANKTWEEVCTWINRISPQAEKFSGTIVLCPSFPFISQAHDYLKSKNSKIILGAQDVSQFEKGPYTGEVPASQIVPLARYVIIGHSERRQNLKEDDHMLSQKIKNSIAASLTPIFCVQDETAQIPPDVEIVAYEPTSAIGSGKADDPQNAANVAQKIKQKGYYTVIYGGSVAEQNVKSFLKKDLLDGVLVSTNSLNPQNFEAVLTSTTY